MRAGETPEPVEPPPEPVSDGTAGSIDPDCSGKCVQSIIGEGAMPFDVSTAGSASVGVDPAGALIISGGQAASGPSFIWVANTEGQIGCTGRYVSKVDTDAMVEVGRYEIGFCDPSRSSVNSNGDVFVASRAGHGVTKVLAAGANCPDTNGDGVITTSSGPNDVLPLGEDDCVAWWTALPAGDVRGIAAQDIPGEITIEPQLDGPPIVTTCPGDCDGAVKGHITLPGTKYGITVDCK